MTQEEKSLLLKDLCARLPYGVIIQEYNEEYGYADNALNTIGIGYFSIHEACIEGTWINHIENVKPYLRPMSSMTEEEKKELQLAFNIKASVIGEYGISSNEAWWVKDRKEPIGFETVPYKSFYDVIDWLNTHHFDYRGLIEKGLAIKAPDGMYKTL